MTLGVNALCGAIFMLLLTSGWLAIPCLVQGFRDAGQSYLNLNFCTQLNAKLCISLYFCSSAFTYK